MQWLAFISRLLMNIPMNKPRPVARNTPKPRPPPHICMCVSMRFNKLDIPLKVLYSNELIAWNLLPKWSVIESSEKVDCLHNRSINGRQMNRQIGRKNWSPFNWMGNGINFHWDNMFTCSTFGRERLFSAQKSLIKISIASTGHAPVEGRRTQTKYAKLKRLPT